LVSVTVTGLPAETLVALTVSTGGDDEDEPIVNVAAAEVPPDGGGVKTVTNALPAETTSVLAIEAVSCVALTTVVGRSAPFHRTVEVETKLVPLTVSVKPALPAAIDEGESELMAGAVLPIDWTVTVGLVAARVNPPFG
jgi:hypothetical protein